MNNWLLFIILFIMAFGTLCKNKKCLITPSFIAVSVMALSTLIVAINTDYWSYIVSVDTIFIISFSCFLFCLGETIGQKNKYSFHRRRTVEITDYSLESPTAFIYWIVIFYGIMVLLLYFLQQYYNARLVGVTGSIVDIVSANRFMKNDQMKSSSLIRLLRVVQKDISYVFLIIYIKNRAMRIKPLHAKKTLVIVLLYVLNCALSSNRGDIIAMAATLIFFVFYFSYSRTRWNINQSNKRTIIKVISIFIMALAGFRLLGYLTGKSNTLSLYDNICIYIGSPIVCLDKVVTGTSNLSVDFQVTLISSLRSMLQRVGIPIQFTGIQIPHQYWGTVKRFGSNVFTSYFPFIWNYGIIGLFVAEFLFGLLYGILWKKIRSSKVTWPFLIIYGNLFFYYICMYSIAERLFSQLLTLTSFVEILVIYILVDRLKRMRYREGEKGKNVYNE